MKKLKEKLKRKEGITLIALVVTIIVLLILAGISITMLTGQNGILNKATEATEKTEIAKEKEMIEIAAVSAKLREDNGELEKTKFKEELDNLAGRDKVQVEELNENFEVLFIDSKRYYEVDKYGSVGNYQIAITENNPGDITKGGTLDGSEEKPYQITCIEDLVAFSNMSKSNTFENKYVVLTRNLNFLSAFSYQDYTTTEFGNINGVTDDGDILRNEMTTGDGFYPITQFKGIFDGNGYEIKNIYINRNTSNDIGFFSKISGNAKIIDLQICGYINGALRVGGLVGFSNANLEIINCIFNGCVSATDSGAGGFIGQFEDRSILFLNCISKGKIESQGNSGGFIGSSYCAHTNVTTRYYNCASYANVTGDYSGGFDVSTGNTHDIYVYNCISAGVLNGSSKARISSTGWEANPINVYLENVFTLEEYNIKPFTSWYGISFPATNNISSGYIQTQDFVNELNSYREKNDEINTIEWAKWKYVDGEYPMLDLPTNK